MFLLFFYSATLFMILYLSHNSHKLSQAASGWRDLWLGLQAPKFCQCLLSNCRIASLVTNLPLDCLKVIASANVYVTV